MSGALDPRIRAGLEPRGITDPGRVRVESWGIGAFAAPTLTATMPARPGRPTAPPPPSPAAQVRSGGAVALAAELEDSMAGMSQWRGNEAPWLVRILTNPQPGLGDRSGSGDSGRGFNRHLGLLGWSPAR